MSERSIDDLAISGDDLRLDGKHILVTGAGRGLGQGIALSAVRCGAAVTVTARSRDQLEQTRSLSEQLGLACNVEVADLSDPEGIPALVARAWERGPIHGVVNAAGVQLRKPAIEVTVDEWRKLHAVNTDAPFFLSTAVAREQLAAGTAGSHVFIGSLNSTIGLPRIAPYAASKTALLGMARVMSTEWSAAGVRANVIGPGYFQTEITNDLLADPAARQRVLSRIPMGQLGLPRDVGALAVFLLSDAARYVSGQLFNVDGGWLAS